MEPCLNPVMYDVKENTTMRTCSTAFRYGYNESRYQSIGSEREKHVFRLQKLDQIYYRTPTN